MRIIGITGTIGAGKGTIVEYLKQRHGFEHYSVRDFLIKEIEKRNLPVNRDTMVEVANELRSKYSPSYIVEQLYEQAKASGKDAIIESIRTLGEISSLRKLKDFRLLAVDALPELRYERIKKRGSITDNVTYETFLENEQREMSGTDDSKQNLAACIEKADYKLTNNSAFEDLYRQIEEALKVIY
ncbi:MAG: AAA family ATPase [Chitinophagales bacterium]|nr:AAA family ATPase [Chitinophagales bacterium]MDW8273964.1 AAA family ATPase [Chitinophagales bacterium]